MIPIIRVYLLVSHVFTDYGYDVSDVAIEAILKLVEQSSIPAYSIMPYTTYVVCSLLLSSGILPSREQTTPSEISPCSQKNDQGVLYQCI